ncbi:hypothetical protein HAX54_028201 [Datura stramonium]|uniref:Uncharacterized protein n=1 Tax=Datura stramonium TaxID=4076 RepID=A0ABS8Y684_DATST|nr:hypothetical protein [Datura stramonium]
MPVRQRSMEHRGCNSSSVGSGPGGASNQSGFSRSPPPPPSPPPLPPPFPVMPYGNLLPPVLESRVISARPVGGVPSQPRATGDQSLHRNPNRKGIFGGRPRGDGSYHNNHGYRRDQDPKDVHLSPQFVPPPGGFIPPQSPGSAPFIPAPLRPFAGPVGYDMPPQFIYVPTLPPESIRGVPIIPPPPPPPFFFPVVDPNLPALLVKQIEYYFRYLYLDYSFFLSSFFSFFRSHVNQFVVSFSFLNRLSINLSMFEIIC